ncbi:MAG: glycosyltransferase family 4 protein [Campylobacterota bacterium]|nr:glycosyltransferase family 4 protein [Campylobacterota bacterium]
MKNIWIINQYTGSPYYGMNYRSYYLAKEFVKQEYNVTIFAGSYSHLFTNIPKTNGLFTNEKIDDIDYVWVKTPKYKSSKSIGRVLNMLIFMINLLFFNIFKIKKPDVIIVSSLSLFPVLNAYIWSKIFKIEFIFEVRDIWPLSLIELGNFSKYHPLVLFLGWFEKFGYKKAKYVVSLLPNAKEHMVSRGMDEKKFRYIPNGINLDEVQNYEEISKELLSKVPKDKFIVGYVGTIGIANALEYFMQSANKLKENDRIHFIIVGKGGEKQKLQEYCDFNNLTNVTFIEPIPKIQVQGMLKYFDVCYIGLKKEKLFKFGVSPNKLFDYMYSSKPIIFAIETKESLVEISKSGISIKSEDSEAIKNAVLKLFNTENKKLDKMGICGHKYVINNHIYKKLTMKYIKLIEG